MARVSDQEVHLKATPPNLERRHLPPERPIRIRRARQRHPLRWIAILLGGSVVVGAAWAGLALIPARAAVRELRAGQTAMEQGRSALLTGDARRALDDFTEARDRFIRGHALSSNPALRLAGRVPILGRNEDALTSLALAGGMVAEAGQEVASTLARVPGGLTAFAPRDGAIALRPIDDLAPAIDRASRLANSALAQIQGSPRSLLLGGVGNALREALDRLGALDRDLSVAAILSHRLPDFLGRGGEKTYFFGVQNPAELRGTGGLLGAYSILHVSDGRLRFGPFASTFTLQDVPADQIEPPDLSYARSYDQYGGAGFWANINMTPDYPSAATAIERLFEKDTGRHVDGVVAADPFALAELLRLTGPIERQGVGPAIDSTNVVSFTTNEAYRNYDDPNVRKRVLGDVARRVFERFLRGDVSPLRAVSVLGDLIAQGHLLVHSRDPEFQEGLRLAGTDGSLAGQAGDLIAVVQNNAAGNKADFYQDRSIDYSVDLQPDRSARARVDIRMRNGAPTSGEPAEVIGPLKGFKPGENVAISSIYCGRSCTLERATRPSAEGALREGNELGHPYFLDYVRIPSGASTGLTYWLTTRGAWHGDDGRGEYVLTMLSQPTIKPTRVRIEIHVPQGMTVFHTNVAMEVSGGLAVWEGIPGRALRLQVTFERPLVAEAVRAVWRFLNRPVFRLGT